MCAPPHGFQQLPADAPITNEGWLKVLVVVGVGGSYVIVRNPPGPGPGLMKVRRKIDD
jgi:hypothetical protein